MEFLRKPVMIVACLAVAVPWAVAQEELKPVPATAEPVMTPGRSAPPVDWVEKPLLLPPSVEYDLGDMRASIAVTLPPLDHAVLVQEDLDDEAQGPCQRRLRVGVPREVAVADASGVWQSVPGVGYIWSTSIISSGAYEMRVHLTDVDMPDGALLWVYSPDEEAENWWNFKGHGPFGKGEFWTPDILGDQVFVEYLVPFDSVLDGDVPAAPFIIDRLQHVYRDLRLSPDGGLRDVSCMADSACWSPWDTVRNGAVYFTIIESPYQYQCSGQLLDTEAGDLTPYFYTAHHCVSTESVAHTFSARFYYQRSTCGGALETYRTVTYANLVSTLATADGTLLLIQGALPTNYAPYPYWSGWTTAAVSYGTDIVGIHHPEGTWKRISFGDKRQTVPVSIEGQTVYTHEARWVAPPDPPGGDVSVTAQGSSGSGMWLESSQLVVGVLSGGTSSCSYTAGSDYYGRFNYAYDYASGWDSALVAGSDDGFEDNDSCAAAVTIGSTSSDDRVVKSTDEDWYKFFLTPCKSIDVDLTFTDAWGDVDMRIYDSCGGSVVASATTNTNNESLLYTPATAGTYYLNVYLDDDTRNEYDLDILIYDNGSTPPPGSCDFDCDGLVQLDDYEDFANCYTGPDAGPLGPTCDIGDTDGDDDLDLRDFQEFQLLYVD